jgi:hypothetical protein
MNDNEPEQPPAEETDIVTLVLQIAVCIAIPYFLWQPLDGFFRPIVTAIVQPLLRAVGL